MRRTASWGSRDAFTDGHISRHAAPREVPTGRRTLAATTRAHRSKRYHAKFPQRGEPRTSCSDPDADWELEHRRVCGAVNDAAARRRSAPEAPQSRGAHQDPQQLRPSVSDDSHLSEGGSSVQAKAAVARAVLCPQAFTHSSSNSMHSSGQQSHTPDQFRSHQNEDRSASELNADHEPQRDGQNGHASLSYTNIQRNLLMPYSASSQHDSLSRRPSLMALPEEAPVDYEDSRDNVQALADNNSSNSGQQRGNATGASSDAQRGMNIRPSMEARRRRLGSSALQVTDSCIFGMAFI